ncbi:YgaP family membrane protein [Sedimenticola sp.]|uniref:YgaP family membrane protein n=1 Tax=Sedimenticola sp. TaxID=1940285 RepID=UPI003D14D587
MTVDRMILAFAGFFILLSLALGWEQSPIFHSTHWHWFTAFVGVNLFQSAFTGFCPLANILKALGAKTA